MSQNERVMLEWSASVSCFKSSWDKSRFIFDHRDSSVLRYEIKTFSISHFSTPDIPKMWTSLPISETTH